MLRPRLPGSARAGTRLFPPSPQPPSPRAESRGPGGVLVGGGPARPALPTATLRPRRAPSRTTRSPHPTRSWAVLTPSLNQDRGRFRFPPQGRSRHLAGLWTPGQRARALGSKSILPFLPVFTRDRRVALLSQKRLKNSAPCPHGAPSPRTKAGAMPSLQPPGAAATPAGWEPRVK